MARTLTRDDLDTVLVSSPDCAHDGGLYLHPACHEDAALNCQYKDGTLTFFCRRCAALVARIAVAEGPKRLVS